MKIGVIFGGMSTENEVSVVSATSVLKNLNKQKYEIYPIYIDKNGKWYECKEDLQKLKMGEELKEITNYLKQCDVIFPVLHGLYGEDGTIQGMLEMLKIPYVGCHVLASGVGMDKVYTKIIFEKAGLKQTPYVYIKKVQLPDVQFTSQLKNFTQNSSVKMEELSKWEDMLKQIETSEQYVLVEDNFEEKQMSLDELCVKVSEKINFPIFVKPSNSGSSVGVTKAENVEQLKNAIEEAGKYDVKILAEQGVDGKEVECAVLGNDYVVCSAVGEILPAEEFYSYDAKYVDETSKTIIPANIPTEISEIIRKQAILAFKAIDGKGLSRVDFFVENKTGEVLINEINTLPGFTNISMYPKLFEKVGIPYDVLLDLLIDLAVN